MGDPSRIGKITIVKSLGISQLVLLLPVLPKPRCFFTDSICNTLEVIYFGNVTSNILKNCIKKIKNVFIAEICNAWSTHDPLNNFKDQILWNYSFLFFFFLLVKTLCLKGHDMKKVSNVFRTYQMMVMSIFHLMS